MLNTTYSVRPQFFFVMFALFIVSTLLISFYDYQGEKRLYEGAIIKNKFKLFLSCTPINILGMFFITLILGFLIVIFFSCMENLNATRVQLDTYGVTTKLELISNNENVFLERDEQNHCFIYRYIDYTNGHEISKSVDFEEAVIVPVKEIDTAYLYVLINENNYQLTTKGNIIFFPGTEKLKANTITQQVFVVPYGSVQDYQTSESIWV